MKRILMGALALVLAVGLAGNAYAAKGDKAGKAGKGGKGVAGTVVKVDGNNVVVQTRGKNAAEVTISTDASTTIEVNGAKGAVSDLKPGMKIQASPSAGTAQKITATSGKGGGKGKKNK